MSMSLLGPLPLDGRPQGAGNGTGRRVGKNAPGVVGEVHRPAGRRAHRQYADDTAAHADTMGAAQQANQKKGEKGGIRHAATRQCSSVAA